MLSKIVIYSFAAIALGIAVMLLPINVMLFFPASYQHQLTTSETPTLTETATPNRDIMGKISVYNATRDLSTLSEAAQFYGKADIITTESAEVEKDATKSFSTPHTSILIPLTIVALTGLLAALSAKALTSRFLKLKMQ